MTKMKCSKCGGETEYVIGEGYVCKYCGSRGSVAEQTDKESALLNTANAKRENYDFDGALEICNKILDINRDNEEANWCALLAKYKVIYLENAEGKWVSTFLSPEADKPITESVYYSKLSRRLQEEADTVEVRRQSVLDEYKKIPNYDVFISYKQHKGNGGSVETEESEWADNLAALMSRNLRVFIDKKSLRGNAGWEPHIYSALQSSKFMVVLASSLENINSPWVKNEWKRFIAFSKNDSSKVIAVASPKSVVPPEKLPDEAMRKVQMVNVEERGWQDELLQRAKSVCGHKLINISDLFEEAKVAIQKNKFRLARSKFEQIIERQPRNARAYWGLLMCRYKAFDNHDIVKSNKKVDKFDEFKSAVEYADDSEYNEFKAVQRAQLRHDAGGYARTNYNIYRASNKNKRIAAIVISAVSACLGCTGAILGSLKIVDVKNTEIAETVISQIDAIGDVTLDSGEYILEAENSYAELNNRQKKKVTNYNSLIDARAVYETMLLISDIDAEITKESLDAIVTAEEAYSALSADQQSKVSNYPELLSARISVDKAFAADVINLIESIGTVNSGSGNAIEAAEKAYGLLTLNQKGIVNNSDVLTDARAVYDVIIVIDGIGTVTLESSAVIKNCEEAYSKLSSAQKKNVINSNVLTDARAVFDLMANINEIGVIDLNSEIIITAAESKYSEMTPSQKKQVSNYGELVDARAAFDTVVLIENIGDVGLNSGAAILSAETAYSLLTAGQKALLDNYSKLSSARSVYDVITLIDGIGAVTLDSGAAISSAERAYGQLASEQKARIINYNELTDARAVYDVMTVIDGIGTVTQTSGSAVVKAELLYEALTNSQKEKIINYSELTEARTIYNAIQSITDIGTVTLQSQDKIEQAEQKYGELTELQKNKIVNYSELADARAVYETMVVINAIGAITGGSQNSIENAESSYSALTAAQKNKVSNYSELVDARAVYGVVVKIDNVGTVTLASDSAISEAESAYSLLTSEQKIKVSNYSLLTGARRVYNVLDLIDGIGAVTLDSETAIFEAEREYSALTDSLKNQITNYSALTEARSVFDVMKLIDRIGAVRLENESLITTAETAYDALDDNLKIKVANYALLTEARATWEALSLNIISYNLNPVISESGEALKATPSINVISKQIKYGSTTSLDAADAGAYYTFLGWYTSDGLRVTDSTGELISDVSDFTSSGKWIVSEDKTLYARWAKISQYSDFNYISNRTELEGIKNKLNGKYLLISNIDISSKSWTAIGEFSGVLDGGNHSVNGLSMGGTFSDTVYVGFFTNVNNATIRNLTFTNVNISVTSNTNGKAFTMVGALAGRASGSSLNVSNVTVNGSVTILRGSTSWGSNNGTGYGGGIFGEMTGGGCLENCTNNANVSVSKGSAKAGGMVGYCNSVNMTLCNNTGAIAANGVTVGGNAFCGGIVGECANYSNSKFTSCTNSGTYTCGGGSDITKYSGSICGRTTG